MITKINKETMIKEIKAEARKHNCVAVYKDGDVCGNDASYENIIRGGGKICVIPSEEIICNSIITRDDWWILYDASYMVTLETLVEEIIKYLEE